MRNKQLILLKRIQQTYYSWFTTTYPGIPADFIDVWFAYLHKKIECRGVTWTIKHVKELRLAFTKFISQDEKPTDHVSRYKDGSPKLIKRFFGILSEHDDYKRLCLTFLNTIRVFKGTDQPSLNDIEDAFRGDESVFERLEKYMPSFKKSLRIKPIEETERFKWFYTTKNGPNGHSISTMYSDINHHTPEELEDLFVVAGNRFRSEFEAIHALSQSPGFNDAVSKKFRIVEAKTSLSRKISVIASPEGKTRTIALGTYWIQAALNPLHKWCFRILQRIPGDLTFDQSRGLSYLNKKEGHSFWSLDLKAATDRFPRRLQTGLLHVLLGKEFATSWDNIISRSFYVSSIHKWTNWSVGQPIGFLSSWAVFALTHHFVIYVALRRARVSPKERCYVILGDDVVICNDKVAIEYKSILNQLGVEISANKSHRSPHSYEIGKRWIHMGQEISPFSITPLIIAKNWSPAITDTVYTEAKRNWNQCNSIEWITNYIFNYNRITHTKDKDRISRLAHIAYSVYHASLIKITWHICFQSIAEQFNLSWDFDPKVADIIARVMHHRRYEVSIQSFWDEDDDDTDEIIWVKGESHSSLNKSSDSKTLDLSILPQERILIKFRDIQTDAIFPNEDPSLAADADSTRLISSLSVPRVKNIFVPRESTLHVMRVGSLMREIAGSVKIHSNAKDFFPDSWLPLQVALAYIPFITRQKPKGLFYNSPSIRCYVEEGMKNGFGLRKNGRKRSFWTKPIVNQESI